jgi:general secretion pathway protein J
MNDGGSGVRGQGSGCARIAAASHAISSRSSRFTPHGFKGFTLLEVLMAVAIMSGIVTVIYASFSTASGNVAQAEAKRDHADLARTLVSKLSNDITNAYYNPSMSETIFYGKQSTTAQDEKRYDSISLTTLTNWRKPDSKESDLWEVGYRFDEQPDKSTRVMVRNEKRELSKDQPPLEGGTEYMITDMIKGFRLRYYSGTTWADEWDSRTRHSLPKAVEIALELTDGSLYITRVEVGR